MQCKTIPLSLTGKRWVFPEVPMQPPEDLVETLAAIRGIDLSTQPRWEHLSDPSEFGAMSQAVERIRRALTEREVVGIIGDYDADGITGVAQLVRFFRRHGTEPHVILPHRTKHGYGVKKEFIDALSTKEVTLLLTVDTGVNAYEEIAYARTLGMDAIVLDHHSYKNDLPDTIILHPTLAGSSTTTPLSGSGIAFTLLRALEKGEWKEQEIDVALAAIGTVADIVPLQGENRHIVALGLEALTIGQGHPVFMLAQSIGGSSIRLTSTHIGFRIAPRINAAGRLADPHLALEALLTGGEALHRLSTLNEQRQAMTERMLREVGELIDSSSLLLAASSPSFHPGIVGLLAGKLTQQYERPSMIGVEHDGLITCSLRSVPPYDITAALERCADHLLSFGGHAMAAGCTLEKGSWRVLVHALLEDVMHVLGEEPRAPTLTIDAVLDPTALHMDTVRQIQLLEPFGEGNPEPCFFLRDQKVSRPRCVGKGGAHLQCTIGQVKAVGFGLGPLLPSLPEYADVICRLGVDTWNEQERAQLFIEDIANGGED